MPFEAGAVTATLDLDRSPFIRSLAAARKSAASFARQTYVASLGVRGAAKTVTELDAVDEKADSIDGRNVDLDVDSDGRGAAHLQSLSGGFKSLAGNIRATGTVLAASTIPFAIAGIGAATPAVLALGASLAGLALNLGKAAAGFGLVGAAAGGGALVGLKAYGSLISKTLSDSRTLWEQENTKAVEALKKQRLAILSNAKGFDAWNQQINSSLIGFTHLEAAVGSRIFPIFTRELGAWTGKLREMRPFIADTAGRIAEIAVGFSRWFRTADDGQVLREVVGFLSVSAERGAKALSALGQIGISAFRPLIPLASSLQKTVLGILGATNKWVQSAEGQQKLGQIYRGLWNDAKKLWPVVRDLSISVGQFFNLLDRTGIADQASRGLRTFAHWLREATEKGGGLEDFLRNAKALMPFVSNAAVAVASAIGNIADAVINARQKGSRLTILQSIFRGIGNAAKPLQRLVVGTFRDLGPEIAKLIPQVARFFSVFAGSSGPLVTFVRVIRRALEIFNDLPTKVKQTVVNLAALKLILGGLGVGAVVGPMGRFASNMLLARGAAARLAGKSALLGVAGGLAKIGLVLAGGIGLGILFYGLKRAYDKNEQFRDSVDKLRDAAGKAFKRISTQITDTLLPAIRRLADKGANIILDIFDIPTGTVKKAGTKAGDATASAYDQALRHRAKRQGTGQGSVGYELGFQLGKGISTGLRALLHADFGLSAAASERNKQKAKKAGMGLGGGLADGFHIGFSKNFNLFQWILNDLKKIQPKAHPWGKGIGEDIRQGILRGIPPLFMLNRLSEALAHAKSWSKNGAGHLGWIEVGKNASLGYLRGFRDGGIGQGILGILNNARKGVQNWQKEHSPSRLWMEQGKNAALGYVKGFGDHIGGLTPALQRTMDDMHVRLLRYGKKLYYTTGKIYSAPGDGTGLIKYPVGTGPLRSLSANQLRQRGSGSVGSGSFGANSRQSSNRGKPGYVQDEDGSWVYNPELYRLQNHYHTGHTYQRGGVGHAFEWTGSGYRYIGGPMGGAHQMAHHAAHHATRRLAGRMSDEWRRTLRYLRAHPHNYDIGGDVDLVDTPRKVQEWLKNHGWTRHGGSLYAPGTPKRYLPGGGVGRGMPQHMGGGGIDKQQMRDVMREHRRESARSGAGGEAIDYNKLAHAIVNAMQQGLPGFIDHSMGGYLNHHNAAGADPR